MRKLDLIDIILLLGILIVIILVVYMILLINTQGYACMNNPIEYFQDKFNVNCFCGDYSP